MNSDEIELIQRAKAGNIAAFEQLVHQHDKRVFSIAARYVNNAEDAKDIYQEVFIRVYRNLAQFKMESEFTTWLHRIAVNVCLTHRSRKRAYAHVSIDADDDDQESHAMELRSREAATDQHSVDAEIREHVQNALDELSPKQRLVFTLKHYDGYKLREIADMMKCTEGTVKRYLFLATQQLRRRLKPVYEQ
ncbi:MAG: sigma-70 family RNA polymerase sigma factor [Ignavibacteriae bacterium]|nr:sigma-70 family RNA polymerase sigma factor [Ignavibacteriota bacterium]